eukprot:3053913-Amphidinium_carterae.2
MSVPEPSPEPACSSTNIHHTSLPLHCGVEPRPDCRVYILWRADACPEGPLHYSGIHLGVGLTAWSGISSVLGPRGYQAGTCRLQRLRTEASGSRLAEAERLFLREAEIHRLPRGVVPRLFIWYCEREDNSSSGGSLGASLSSQSQ